MLELLSLGASETEIAAAMNLKYSGVRYHVEKLKEKFRIRNSMRSSKNDAILQMIQCSPKDNRKGLPESNGEQL